MARLWILSSLNMRCPNLCGNPPKPICGRTIERYIDLLIDTMLVWYAFQQLVCKCNLLQDRSFHMRSEQTWTPRFRSQYVDSSGTSLILYIVTIGFVLRVIDWAQYLISLKPSPEPIDHLLRLVKSACRAEASSGVLIALN